MSYYVVRNKLNNKIASSVSTRRRVRRGVYTNVRVVAIHVFLYKKDAQWHARHLNRSEKIRGTWKVKEIEVKL